MSKLTNGAVEIEFERSSDGLEVKLKADQYQQGSISDYRLFLQPNFMQFQGEITGESEEELAIKYELPSSAQSVAEVAKSSKTWQRIELARKLSSLQQSETGIAPFFIHPENLFLVSNQLYVAHRGMLGSVEPRASDQEDFFRQYKALVLFVMQPKYRFDELLTIKTETIKQKKFATLWQATSILEIEHWLDEQYHRLQQNHLRSYLTVKKSRHRLFKFSTFLLGIMALVAGVMLGMLLENTVPRQNRIIDAQSSFVMNNFGEVATLLATDEPRSLPPVVQFMLATSHVELSSLSSNQRQVLINNLSPNSHENELLYWIYSGRGDLITALDIAYSLGDTQLKLHAYANRYDYIEADMQMPGTTKQEYLTRYRRRMEELLSLLEGVDGDE